MSNLIYRRAKAVLNFKNALRFVSPVSDQLTENRVQVPYQPYHDFGANDFCISLWAYPVIRAASAPIGSNVARYAIMSFLQDGLGAGLPAIVVFLEGAGGTASTPSATISSMRLELRVKLANNTTTTRFLSANTLPNMTGVWNHLIFQRAGTSLQLWRNGILVQSQTITSTEILDVVGTNILLGGGGGTPAYNGYMDEFAIFNSALTSDEIAAIFNSGLGANPPLSTFDNIVSYWRFDSINGRTLTDNTLLYNNLYNPGNGILLNYTDAQVAAGGQPQSGQTAWVDHFTLVPTTVDALAFGYSVTGTGTPVTRFSAEFIATAGTDINAYVPETGPSLTRIMSGWLISPSVSPALTGTGRLAGTGTGWSVMTAPIAQRSVRAVIQNIQFAGTGVALVQLFSNAGGTFGIRGQIYYDPATPTTAIIYIIFDGITNADAGGDTFFQKIIPFTNGQDLTVETDGLSVTVSYGAQTLVRSNLFQFAGSNAILALNGSNSSIDKFTITDYI